ncbi:cAMP receptor protein [Maioricimonas rarisocia]|uniref:cAMP receptor protein n=1 Tax=Maioricimonas rarisocia TaxID=2528026 RepID=A0A517ZE32_9PLAN|nr:GNAT family N-acetyltransferase [Maioricimonas rarisocia]QDU40743.1 cAMP receptor protein [Maioricimonas rarisocia]
MTIHVRDAVESDVAAIRDIFVACYGGEYPYQQFLDVHSLKKLVFADDTVLLAAEDDATGRVVGTASVVSNVGAWGDLAAEFGRLAVHPDARGAGVGNMLMQERLGRVRDRIHVGVVENRVAHPFSQRISVQHGFVPVGFLPLKLKFHGRGSVALFTRHFGDAMSLRRNHPRIIPEVYAIAERALENCGLNCDVIVETGAVPYPHLDDFELQTLSTEGYATLLRFQRGRVHQREVFGPVRLHYGMFQIRARNSRYLLALSQGQVVGGVGIMIDEYEHSARIFEVITVDDRPVRFLLSEVERICRTEWGIEYVEIDVNAHAPRMQKTLLQLGFHPVGYVPALAFHDVERFDVVKMARLNVPAPSREMALVPQANPFADLVIDALEQHTVVPRVAAALPRIGMFRGMTDEQSEAVASACSVTEFPSGTRVFQEGHPGSRLYMILDGQIDVLVGETPRKVGTAQAGETLGEMSLISQPCHSATAVAGSSVTAAVLTHEKLRKVVDSRPDIGVIIYRNLAEGLGQKLRRLDETMTHEAVDSSARPIPSWKEKR